jgi:hypothetical protein
MGCGVLARGQSIERRILDVQTDDVGSVGREATAQRLAEVPRATRYQNPHVTTVYQNRVTADHCVYNRR